MGTRKITLIFITAKVRRFIWYASIKYLSNYRIIHKRSIRHMRACARREKGIHFPYCSLLQFSLRVGIWWLIQHSFRMRICGLLIFYVESLQSIPIKASVESACFDEHWIDCVDSLWYMGIYYMIRCTYMAYTFPASFPAFFIIVFLNDLMDW